MKIKLSNRLLLIFIIAIALIFVLAPILIFIIHFHTYAISSKIDEWGSFGDYFGGIINPIISLFSLIILGYITYLLSKQSNLENKKLNILTRKMDAYEALTHFIPDLNQMPSKISSKLSTLTQKIEYQGLIDINILENDKDEILQLISFYSEFYYFLFCFNVRFGHLFEYDFNSNSYSDLLKKTKLVKDKFDSMEESIIFNRGATIDLGENFIDQTKYLTDFINSIRDELK